MRYLRCSSLFICLFLITRLGFTQQDDYFQQNVSYIIDVTLDDHKNELRGEIQINYTNNSPDNLYELYFHLWPNAYTHNVTPLSRQLIEFGNTDIYLASDRNKGYIDSLSFSSNGTALTLKYDSASRDIAKIILENPLQAGASCGIKTPFKVKIPKSTLSRMGRNKSAYHIAQWYPKPAVYNKDGWQTMPNKFIGEFFSDFATYTVNLTLPKNYLVSASAPVVSESDYSDQLKTIRFEGKQIHEFAFFTDSRYQHIQEDFKLESGKTIKINCMYTSEEAHLWKNAIQYIKDGLQFYSKLIGDYPYEQLSVVSTYGSSKINMEYPALIGIAEAKSEFELETAIVHEIGYNWFYGALNTNESLHSWMDEGINSYYSYRFILEKYPESTFMGHHKTVSKYGKFLNFNRDLKHELDFYYLMAARRNMDQAMNTPTEELSPLNYKGVEYGKTALSFFYLSDYLGQELFDKIMHSYFEKWKFKHPEPKHLRTAFKEKTDKPIDWFFIQMVNTTKKIDYAITSIKESEKDTSRYLLQIKNKGEIHAPFSVSSLKGDSIISTIWYEGFKEKTELEIKKGADAYRIDAQYVIPEYNKTDNTIKAYGIFKKLEPFRFQPFISIEDPYKTQVLFSPIVAWNNYDQTMIGISTYSQISPTKKLDYFLNANYGTGSGRFTGINSMSYNWYPKNVFSHVRIGAETKHFSFTSYYLNSDAHYEKYSPYLSLDLFKKDRKKPVQFNITLRHTLIRENVGENPFTNAVLKNQFNELIFSGKNPNKLTPFKMNVHLQQHQQFVKLMLQAEYGFLYHASKRGVKARVFHGRFLYNDNVDGTYQFAFTKVGRQDYMYDELFLGRSEIQPNALNNQLSSQDGNFKQFIIGTYDSWLTAINIEAELPEAPFGFYFDLGIAAQKNRDQFGNEIDLVSPVLYDGGVFLTLVPTICRVYFPVLNSHPINDIPGINLSYAQQVRFSLNLNQLNLFEQIRKKGDL